MKHVVQEAEEGDKGPGFMRRSFSMARGRGQAPGSPDKGSPMAKLTRQSFKEAPSEASVSGQHLWVLLVTRASDAAAAAMLRCQHVASAGSCGATCRTES